MPENEINLFRRLIGNLFRLAKQDPDYRLSNSLPMAHLLSEVIRRGMMMSRGLLYSWRFRRVQGCIFIGKRVCVRGGRNMQIGRSLSLHNDVTIDARCLGAVKFGDNVTIREHSIIECTGVIRFPGEDLSIGNNVGISQYCIIGVRGSITIGDDVQIGPRVTIYSENHNFQESSVLIRNQGVRRQGIVIEDDCWLGAGSIVLDGVRIGRGSVVAAGAVVTKSFPPNSVIAGVPGRRIGHRGIAEQRGLP